MAAKSPRNIVAAIKHYGGALVLHYKNLHIFGKAFIWLVVLFYIVSGVFIIVVTPSRIAQFSYDQAQALAKLPFGWIAFGAPMLIISFPPLIGHTTLITLCGFAYGMKGFLISFPASILGSAFAFVVLRYLFSERLHQWSSNNNKWQALESVVGEKGLPLIILIRISPLPPWVYSNSLFASIEAVKLWQFVVATCFISPKLLLHTFIGSKIAALSDGDQRGEMDTSTKVLNGLLVGGGLAVAAFTSWWIYTLVQGHVRHLEGFPADVDELAAEAIEDFDEEAPLLASHS